MIRKYLVIDTSDAYEKYVSFYDDVEKMLESIQHREPADLQVFEIAKEIKLIKRPSIILDKEERKEQ